MATINLLLQQPGPFITALLPNFQELVRLRNPYLNNQAAAVIFEKMRSWGDNEIRSEDFFYALDNKGPTLKEFGNGGNNKIKGITNALQNSEVFSYRQNAETSAFIKNFVYKMNAFDMGAANAWLNFQKMVDLFYKMVDVSDYFSKIIFDTSHCPPGSPNLCLNRRNNDYFNRIGVYSRPLTTLGTEGTGFRLISQIEGDAGTKEQVAVGFTVQSTKYFECPPELDPCPDFTEYVGRYFALNYNTAADNWDVFWYEVDAVGAAPTFAAGGTINYIKVEIASADTVEAVRAATDAAVIGTTHWALVTGRQCPPADGSGCIWKITSVYEADVVGARTNPVDGTDGFFKLETTMLASDGTTLASGVVTNQEWVDTHNNVRRAYELNELSRDVMYLKGINIIGVKSATGGEDPCENVDPPCDCCEIPGAPNPCVACFIIIQTPWEGNINHLPINAPGVIGDNRAGRNRLQVFG